MKTSSPDCGDIGGTVIALKNAAKMKKRVSDWLSHIPFPP
jgi:hypothetical protein